MHLPDFPVPVTVSSSPPSSAAVDVLVVPVFEDEAPPLARTRPDGVAARLSAAAGTREFTGKIYSLFHTPVGSPAWSAAGMLLVGVGTRSAFALDRLRRAATAAALDARQRKCRRVGFVIPGALPMRAEVQASVEGLVLAAFHAGSHKTDPLLQPTAFEQFVICAEDGSTLADASAHEAARRGAVLGHCSNLARALANEPGNVITPSTFAEFAAEKLTAAGLGVEVLDESQLDRLNMHLLLGVARGSAAPPRLLVVRYEPAHPVSTAVLGLVGKGVTFDAGGISIKASDGMSKMKSDMSGGAAVVAAMLAIAELQPPVRVVGVVPLVENMPGGRALKPGDVVRSAEGKTIEVLDTDAEGRLILADALWFARQQGATHLVDIATLTGAITVALGRTTSGLFATPDGWADLVGRTATLAGDRVWRLPLFEDYRDQLRSDIADFANIGGRPAGAITAAVLLKEFTGGLPWAHLDIAATAWAEEAQPYQLKGPTGVGVRTLATLPESVEEWPGR